MTITAIEHNPRKKEIVEDFEKYHITDIPVIMGRNYGLSFFERAEDGEYVNYPTGFFVNKGDEESAWAKALIEVTNTEEFQKKFDEIFQGAYMIFDYEG